ncbi:MAG: hypothetical protein EP329_11155 [Deltaproteobacteria bacterium]|nr:MAG: hypothetical protein EP329_11155 [Deltaproteobacteria bacterium]
MKTVVGDEQRVEHAQGGQVERLRERFESRHEQLREMSFEQGSDLLSPQREDAVVSGLRGSGLVERRVAMFGGGGAAARGQGPQRPADTERPLSTEASQPEQTPVEAQGPQPPQAVIAHNERSNERREEAVDELLERRQEERRQELEALGGDPQDRDYKGHGVGLALRHVSEDPRLDYQAVRDTDTMGFAKRHRGKLKHKAVKGTKDAWKAVKETTTSKQGFKKNTKKGVKKVVDKGVNLIPLVGASRDLATTKKESKRVKRLGRIRDDAQVPELGQRMASGLAHTHKTERLTRAVGGVGGVVGSVVAGPVGLIKGVIKAGIVGADEAGVKEDRQARVASRLPERGDAAPEEHRSRVDAANESLVGLTKEDPSFSAALVDHLSSRGAMSHDEELGLARQRQGDDDAHLLKPSLMRGFGQQEGARLALREELGAGPGWVPGKPRDEGAVALKQSKQEHKALDKRLEQAGHGGQAADLNTQMKRRLVELGGELRGREQRLADDAKSKKQTAKDAHVSDVEQLEGELKTRLQQNATEEATAREQARQTTESEQVEDRRGRMRRRLTRNPKKKLLDTRLAEISKAHAARREEMEKETAVRIKARKGELKKAIRQVDIDLRKAREDFAKERIQRIVEVRDGFALRKRVLLGERSDAGPTAPAPQLGAPKRRNVLAEMHDIEQHKSWEKH